MINNDQHAFRSGWLVIVFLAILVATNRANEPLPGFLPSVKVVKDLVLPLGDAGGKPVLKFLCGRAHIERKSVGFLKIGFLPQLVLEDVEVRVVNSPTSASWAGELNSFLVSNTALSGAVIRNFGIRVSERDGFVRAAKARFDQKAQVLILEMLEVQCAVLDTLRGAKGVIYLQGPNAGRLSLAETANRIIQISDEGFVLSSN